MSNRRNKRRFYPEFYTDEELEQDELTEENEQTEYEEYEETGETEKTEETEKVEETILHIENIKEEPAKIEEPPEKDVKPEEIYEVYDEDYIQSILGRIKKPEEPVKVNEPEPEIEPENKIEPEIEPEIKSEPENAAAPGIIPFDREKAIEYARRWALDRNPNYYDFDDIGGDCTNYISQILLAGGCKMDKSSVIYGRYYNNANDKSPSWTGVEQLRDYLVREKDYGIIAHEIDLNEVKAGDIAQISFNGKTFQHTPFIISVKRNSDDTVSYDHIKICAHSFDSENRALDTYQWKKIRFIRIVGFKEG